MKEAAYKYKVPTIILSVLIIYMLLSRILLIFSYSLDLDGVEFTFIHYAQKLLFNKPLYSDIDKYPFDIVIHMPFYPYISSTIFKLLHLTSVNDIHSQLVVCRLISFAFLPFCLMYIIKILWLNNKNIFSTLSVVCFFMLLLCGHFYTARQDALKTTLFFMYLFYTIKYLQNKKPARNLIYSGIILLVAINLKQDTIIYFLIFTGCVCVNYNRKKSLILVILLISCLLITFAAGYFIWGKSFIENTVLFNFQANTNYFNSYNFLAMIFSLIRTFPLFVFLIYLHTKNKNTISAQKEIRILLLFSYVTYIVSHLLILRGSSYINYTHESIAVILISIGSLLNLDTMPKTYMPVQFALIFLLFLSSFIIHTYPIKNKSEKSLKQVYFQNIRNRTEIKKVIQKDTAFFITCDNTIFYPEENLVFGYDYYIDQYIYAYLGFITHTKLLFIDKQPYDNYVHKNNIRYIIAKNNGRDKMILAQKYSGYVFYKKVNNLLVYKLQ